MPKSIFPSNSTFCVAVVKTETARMLKISFTPCTLHNDAFPVAIIHSLRRISIMYEQIDPLVKTYPRASSIREYKRRVILENVILYSI